MEDNFRKALQSSPEEFLDLVEKHQSRSEKSSLKTLVWSLNNKPSSNSISKLCDALSLHTARAIFAFENLSNGYGQEDGEEGNEIFKTPSPQKKRRRRITRSQRSPIHEPVRTEPENDRRRAKILNSLRGYSYLAQLCIMHPQKALSLADFFSTVHTLHDKLVLFEGDCVLQDCITAICEQWWRDSLPGKESLIAQSLPWLLAKSLSVLKCLATAYAEAFASYSGYAETSAIGAPLPPQCGFKKFGSRRLPPFLGWWRINPKDHHYWRLWALQVCATARS